MATIPNDEQLNRGIARCAACSWHRQGATNRRHRVAGGLHLWVSRDARPDRERIAHGGLRRIDLVTAFLSERRTPLSHRTSTPCVYLYLYTSPRAANRPCDGRHQKRECDTNFFVCLLIRRYRIDALALPLVCFAPHRGSRTVFCHAQRTVC